MNSKENSNDLTSAGVPVPDFVEQSTELQEEYWWRMKTYEENYIEPYLQELKQRYENR